MTQKWKKKKQHKQWIKHNSDSKMKNIAFKTIITITIVFIPVLRSFFVVAYGKAIQSMIIDNLNEN